MRDIEIAILANVSPAAFNLEDQAKQNLYF